MRYDEEKNPVYDLFYFRTGDNAGQCESENAALLADWILTKVESIKQDADE